MASPQGSPSAAPAAAFRAAAPAPAPPQGTAPAAASQPLLPASTPPAAAQQPAEAVGQALLERGGKRRGGKNASSSAAAPPARLGPAPQHDDPLEGVGSLRSGRGQALAPVSAERLMAALSLFGGDTSAAAPAAPVDLPTGAAWDVVAVVTPDGLQPHAVAPGHVVTADVRGE